MKKLIAATYFTLFSLVVLSQSTTYDFSTPPLTNGWAYYDDYGSSPYPGFVHDAPNQRLSYQLTGSWVVSFLHRDLPVTLSEKFCVTFSIQPTNSANFNSFFPLVLTPNELTGTDIHPWRENAAGTSSGQSQDLDFLAVEVKDDQLRLFSRDDNVITSNTVQPMVPAFYLQNNVQYWIKLELTNQTTVILSVYQDAAFSNLLNTSTFTIPSLDAFNHLYIANSNGNYSTTQYGYLDDYVIDACNPLSAVELTFDTQKKKLVKITDVLGRETNIVPNTPLFYLYEDGTTEKVVITE